MDNNIEKLIKAGIINEVLACGSETCHHNSHDKYAYHAAEGWDKPIKGFIEYSFVEYSSALGDDVGVVYLPRSLVKELGIE